MGSPRVDVVFRLWQCDKKNHGWREGPPVTVSLPEFRSAAGPSPSGKVSLERKRNTAFLCSPRVLTQNFGRFFCPNRRLARWAPSVNPLDFHTDPPSE